MEHNASHGHGYGRGLTAALVTIILGMCALAIVFAFALAPGRNVGPQWGSKPAVAASQVNADEMYGFTADVNRVKEYDQQLAAAGAPRTGLRLRLLVHTRSSTRTRACHYVNGKFTNPLPNDLAAWVEANCDDVARNN